MLLLICYFYCVIKFIEIHYQKIVSTYEADFFGERAETISIFAITVPLRCELSIGSVHHSVKQSALVFTGHIRNISYSHQICLIDAIRRALEFFFGKYTDWIRTTIEGVRGILVCYTHCLPTINDD